MRPTASSGIDRLSQHGKLHDECRALTGRAGHTDLAGMFLDDAVGHRQPQTCATAVSRLGLFALGGEEWIIDAMDMLLRDSCARIRHFHLHVMAIGGADHQRAARGHCVFGIQEQIEKNLLQLSRVPVNRRQLWLQIGLHFDARGLELMIEQGQRVLYDAIQVHIAEFGARGTREVQQTVHDFRSAKGLARDLVQQAGLLLVAVDLLGQHLCVGGDDSQRSVDFVRDSGCESCDSSSIRSVMSSTMIKRPMTLKSLVTSGAIAILAIRASPAVVPSRNLYRLWMPGVWRTREYSSR